MTLTLGVRGLFDGLTGTLLRQMTYSMMRFAVYDEAKKAVHTGECLDLPSPRPRRPSLSSAFFLLLILATRDWR